VTVPTEPSGPGPEASQTRWLIGLGLALVALIVALSIQGEADTTSDPNLSAEVWSVDADQITTIRIEGPEGALRLNREGDRWWLVEPVRSKAEPERVQAALDALAIRLGKPVVGVTPDQYAEFGLGEPPHLRVVVGLEQGLERTLDIGLPTPVDFQTYARAADGSVVAVPGDLNRALGERAEVFRDHRMFDVDPSEVRAVTLWSPEGKLRMVGQGKHWALEGFGRADPVKVDDVVMGLLDLRYDVLWDTGQAIGAPTHGAIVELEDGSTQELRVGESTPMGVASSTSDGRFGTLYAEMLAQLGRGPTSIAATEAFPVDLDTADEIRVEVDGLTVVARRNGPAWEADGRRADLVYGAVRALSEVPAHYRLDPPTGAASGAGQIVVREGDRLLVVLLGEEVDGFRIVMDAAHEIPYRVPADALNEALGLWR
jgi:hypothetical protein